MAPTRAVVLRQNVGYLVARSTRTFSAEVCRDCLREVCRRYSLTTALAGWWGVVSLLVTPFYLAGNLREYWASRTLPAPGAELAQTVADRTREYVLPHRAWINEELAKGRDLTSVAADLAARENLPAQDVEVTLRLLSR